MLRALLTAACAVIPVAASAAVIPVAPGQSIQAAIVAAQNGDRIEVAPGTYAERLDLLGKEVTVVGTGGPTLTVLDGTGLGDPVVLFRAQSAPGAVLEGMTITGGVTTGLGAGVRCEMGAFATLRDCRITGNTAAKGGGLFADSCHITLEHCLVDGNTATLLSGFPGFEPCGGIAVAGAFLVLRHCTVRQNTGGGLGHYLAGDVTLDNCRFEDHAGHPAAVLKNCNIMVEDSTFLRNSARALLASTYGPVVVRRCTFLDNGSTEPGGALLAYSAPIAELVRLESCVFARNQATIGSAVSLEVNDEAGSHELPEAVTVESCTFVDNGPGAAIHSWSNGAYIHNSIVRGTAPAYSGGSQLVVAYSNVQGGAAGPGNLDVDPQFVDPAQDDYHLRAGSPCAGAGDPAGPYPPDLDGNPREPGTQSEIGADERKPALVFDGGFSAGATARLTIHGTPAPAPAILVLATDVLPGPGPFLLAPPFVPVALVPLPATGFLAFSAVIPAGFLGLTVYGQAWTGADLTTVARADLW